MKGVYNTVDTLVDMKDTFKEDRVKYFDEEKDTNETIIDGEFTVKEQGFYNLYFFFLRRKYMLDARKEKLQMINIDKDSIEFINEYNYRLRYKNE